MSTSPVGRGSAPPSPRGSHDAAATRPSGSPISQDTIKKFRDIMKVSGAQVIDHHCLIGRVRKDFKGGKKGELKVYKNRFKAFWDRLIGKVSFSHFTEAEQNDGIIDLITASNSDAPEDTSVNKAKKLKNKILLKKMKKIDKSLKSFKAKYLDKVQLFLTVTDPFELEYEKDASFVREAQHATENLSLFQEVGKLSIAEITLLDAVKAKLAPILQPQPDEINSDNSVDLGSVRENSDEMPGSSTSSENFESDSGDSYDSTLTPRTRVNSEASDVSSVQEIESAPLSKEETLEAADLYITRLSLPSKNDEAIAPGIYNTLHALRAFSDAGELMPEEEQIRYNLRFQLFKTGAARFLRKDQLAELPNDPKMVTTIKTHLNAFKHFRKRATKEQIQKAWEFTQYAHTFALPHDDFFFVKDLVELLDPRTQPEIDPFEIY